MSLLQTREERRWFGERFEEIHGEELTVEEKIGIATLMLKAQVTCRTDVFLHFDTQSYTGQSYVI